MEPAAYLILYALLLIGYLLTLLLGNGIMSLFMPQKPSSKYLTLMVGILTTTTLFAVFKTAGQSILSLYLILSLWMVYRYKSSFDFGWRWHKIEWKKDLLYPSFVATIFFLLGVYSFVENTTQSDYFFVDYYFYARESAYLKDFGVENTMVEYFLAEKGGAVPYHYLELWLNGFISGLTGIHALKSLILITYPLLYTVLSIGLLKFLSSIQTLLKVQNNSLNYLLIFLFFVLSIPDLNILIGTDLLHLPDIMFPVLGHHKYVFIYLFGCLIFDAILKNKLDAAALAICFLVTAQVSVAIPLMISIGLYFIFHALRQRESLLQFLNHLIPMVITAIYFYLFYHLFGDSNNITLSQSEFFDQYDSKAEIIRIINIIGKTTLQIIFNGSILILIVWKFKLYKQAMLMNAIVFSMLVHFIGLVTWAVFNQMQDSVQLWSNAANIAFIFTIWVILIVAIHQFKSKRMRFWLGSILIVLFLSQDFIRYRKHYNLIEFSNIFRAENQPLGPSPRIAFMKEQSDYKNTVSKYEQIYNGQTFELMRLYDPLELVCISIDEIKNESQIDEKYYNLLTMKKYQDMHPQLDIKNLQLKFLKEKNISHLMVYKERPLPQHLEMLFNSESSLVIDGYAVYERLN